MANPETDPECAASQAEWQAQYEFWHKIISEDVSRLRFNNGLEPLDVDLFQIVKKCKSDPDYLGFTQIGPHKFEARAHSCFNKEGKEILRVQIRAA